LSPNYSAILGLLHLFNERKSAHPEDVLTLAEKTPTERIETLIQETSSGVVQRHLKDLLASYEKFLEHTDRSKRELESAFSEKDFKRERLKEARAFGDSVYEAVRALAEPTSLLRYMLV
jgi:hypothetical protein